MAKKTSGMGKFEFRKGKPSEELDAKLREKSSRHLLISTALPMESELEQALKGASYLLEKRSGYVASAAYAPEWQKKKDLYVFASGSCFANCFSGDIYDVSDGGRHSVYRYAKSVVFGGVSMQQFLKYYRVKNPCTFSHSYRIRREK